MTLTAEGAENIKHLKRIIYNSDEFEMKYFILTLKINPVPKCHAFFE